MKEETVCVGVSVCVGAAQRKGAVSRLCAFEPERGNTPSLLPKEGLSSGHFGEGKVWRWS